MTRQQITLAAMAALSAASLAACNKPAPATAVDTGKISDAVKADVHQLVVDFNAHDVDKAVSHDAPGMVGMFHGAPNVVGPEQDKALTTQQIAASPNAAIAVSDESVDVAAAGDMAIYRATYAFTATDPKTKAPMAEHGNWVVGYKPAADGSWKIAWNVISDTPAPAPAASSAPASSAPSP